MPERESLRCGSEAHADLETALGPGAGGERGAVRAGDRLDDGEAEPVPGRAAGGPVRAALEWLEQALDPAVGDHRSGVRDREAGPARRGRRDDLDAPSWPVVAQPV